MSEDVYEISKIFNTKKCGICKIIKSLDKFSFDNKQLGRISYCCKECDNARRRKHQHANREHGREVTNEYRKNNKDKSRNMVGNAGRRYRNKVRETLLQTIGVGNEEGNIACVRCGFDDARALQIDHINGGGYRHLITSGSHPKYYKSMLVEPEKYQILCANCNWIKRYEDQEVKRSKYVA